MSLKLALALLKIRVDENGLSHQKKKDEEFYDCDNVTSNDGATASTKNLEDSSEKHQILLEQHNNISHKKEKEICPVPTIRKIVH